MGHPNFHTFPGYQIGSSVGLPPEVLANMWKCSDSYSTTDHGRKHRIRFLPSKRVPGDLQEIIEDFLTSFEFLYSLTVKEQDDQNCRMGEEFIKMIEESADLFDRYFIFITAKLNLNLSWE
jgi:hypothetical protein